MHVETQMDAYKSRKYVHIKSNLVKKKHGTMIDCHSKILVAKQVKKGS